MAFSVPLWNKKKAALALGSTAWRPNFVSNQETGSELSYVVPNRTWVGFVIINYINITSKTLDLLLVKFVPLKKNTNQIKNLESWLLPTIRPEYWGRWCFLRSR